ncbi:oxalate/formate MFS antiporter [Ammoniphilus oxalaticus]|uniref:Oxalate/formate MFS antiporter n=1 Tax=Ammoniphilus oxalaticus TaxID=66863 RepID=A0A419SRH1_9BACL|nr:oxalate/formate MFS antiporter [Ammoniphilus oxalaticus]RKD27034.1 oxalate/formate MFS antiporter [Ammoniphilus oxalaticus]
MSTSITKKQLPNGLLQNKWFHLICAVLLMTMISGVQYSWTLYSNPLKDKLGVSLAVVQTAFTLSQVIQAGSQPTGGYFVDKFGPRMMLILSGAMVLLGWSFMGRVNSVPALYALYTLAGAGVGIVYGTAINTATRWFPNKRGLASGFTAAGYGMGVLPFLPVISSVLETKGVGTAFMLTGFIEGIVIILIAFVIRFPQSAGAPGVKKVVTEKDFTSKEMLKTAHFWVLWAAFFSINFGGLLLVANSAPYAKSIGIPIATITIAVSIQNIANGSSRPVWGAVSDKIGRFKTMSIVFFINSIVLFFFPTVAKINDLLFIAMLALAFFTWGGSYALFPSINTDLFGTAYSAQNYGFFWAAKATAAIFGGGVGAAVATALGWQAAFTITAATSFIAFALATFVIPRMGKPTKGKSVVVEATSK